MKTVKNLIIGFGKGGKTLAGALASAGESVLLVEASEKMFGGTCINVACIPTKAMEFSSRLSKAQGGNFEDRAARYRQAVEEKAKLTAALRQKNYDKAVSAGVEVLVGTASPYGIPHMCPSVFPMEIPRRYKPNKSSSTPAQDRLSHQSTV